MTPQEELAALRRLAELEAKAAPPLPGDKPLDYDPTDVRQSSIFPVRTNPDGSMSFDSDAGIVGAIKRTVMAPGQVLKGELDPNSPEGERRATEAAMVMSPLPASMRAGERVVPGVLKAKQSQVAPKVPTADALKEASEKGYNQARDMGVDYSSTSVKNLAADVQQALEADGVLAELSPKTFAILGKLQSPPADSVATIAGIEAARRALGHAAGDFANKTEQYAAQRAIKRLDEFLMAGDPANVVSGPAAAAGQTIKDARGNYAAAMRSDKITGAQERAEFNAAVANSGQNLDNATRQRIRDILTRPKEARGYSPEELAALEGVARGGIGTNTARTIGNLLGGGGGLGAMLTGSAGAGFGALGGGPVGAALGATAPAVGMGAKKLANALTMRGVKNADEMVRKRSPLYEKLKADAPWTYDVPEKNAALIRALMANELEGQD